MIIIGEKLNGTIPKVKVAIQNKDKTFIRDLAVMQAEAGAHYIDVCAGTSPDLEVETLKWIVDLVQNAVETPICIDSPNTFAIKEVFSMIDKPGIINSVSEEGGKCEEIFPLIEGTTWQVIALTCDNKGIPSDTQTRVNITKSIVGKAALYDIVPERIHVDPLVMAISADNQSMLNFLETLKTVKELFPTIKVTSGLSNISFGTPLRNLINQKFFTIAIYEGMDSAIIDPLNREMMGTLLATKVLLGQDRHCRKFNNAFRAGKIGLKRQ